MSPQGIIPFSNRYYVAKVPVSIYPFPRALPQPPFRPVDECVRASPAVVVIADAASDDNIAESKRIWHRIARHCCHSAVKLLFVRAHDFSEHRRAALVAWAVPLGVHVISTAAPEEDGLPVAHHVERALECAEWPLLTLHTPCRGRGEPNERRLPIHTHIQSNPPALQQPDLLKPTSVRRALDAADVSRLEAHLLLADLTDSDSSS
ncbi:unnamed protein product [Chondrus crispus]|uniref:Uncharacterized protein n=1 Tax=Chondrus crispus TaxID=2769 RepID=R7QC93_CHOCR|nr:unnamed protein product [Chondrus crispus]CDF35021.1 unnamed protein product [Chondrus crispus]|eukprot:XP_005714840.1 unnamed protein product [Chondrus crispus]